MVNLMQGPIPGQSLTDAPKNSPWEKPSELNKIAECLGVPNSFFFQSWETKVDARSSGKSVASGDNDC